MLPKLTLSPLAIEAEMPMMSGICSTGTLSRRAQAAAAAITPTVPTVCQPPTLDAKKFARPTRAATSKPMMVAAMASTGVAPVISATGSTAGMTAEAACPAT